MANCNRTGPVDGQAMPRLRAPGQPWFYPIAFWMAILVVLASALVPQGLPSSRSTGSAFSPSTSTVALKARASQPVALAPRLATPPVDPPDGMIPTVTGLVAKPALAIAIAPVAAPAVVRAAQAIDWRQPRAPPSFPMTSTL
ncbi:MAG: hypothetical protein ABW048_14380 [Sphingobium sp.]